MEEYKVQIPTRLASDSWRTSDRWMAILFIGLGLLLAFQGVRGIIESITVLSWFEMEGRVTSSRILHGSKGSKSALIDCLYIVNGLRFRKEENISGKELFGESAQTLVNRFHVGAKIPVFYDPERPFEAILYKRRDTLTPFLMVMGGLLLSLIVGYLRFFLKKRE